MCEEDVYRTFLDTNPAEVAFFWINDVGSIFFENGLSRTDLFASTTLVADMNFEGPRFGKFPLDMDGRLFWIVLLKMSQAADQFTK
jgi:hypothetical protein